MVLRTLCCIPASRPRPAPADSLVDLSHFTLMRVVGKGTSACVRIAERRTTAGLYALKIVHKARAVRTGAAPSLLQERRLLEEIAHPFLVNMHFAFQDEVNCYLVLDLMLGGDLRFHLRRRGSLGENTVRFYVGEISSALAYLHQKGICHRDVKPENILLDYHGHAHLTDFNAAMHYSEKTFHAAVAGTIVYMAPEMLAHTGYSWPVDYWSLGVTAYECLFYGRRPFADRCRDAARVTDAILHDALVFPDAPTAICSPEGRAALAALLERNPAKRLGCRVYSRRRGQAQLRAHAWFRDLAWDRLDAGQVAPPFLPDQSTWNFEEFDAAPEHALRERINRLSHMSEKVSAVQRHLEEQFIPYDSERMPRKAYHHSRNEAAVVVPRYPAGEQEKEQEGGVMRESMVGAVRLSGTLVPASSDAGHSSNTLL